MSLSDRAIKAAIVIVPSLIAGLVAVWLARKAGKPAPAALLVGLTVALGAMGSFSVLL
ncbi:hypothetical protein AB0C33_15315 [Nonomuraea sp. NPDC048881]|uniref:hypothetical protein n=1 Tax=Nonomuraea sp. NPDC048881 TaxID=3155030 RepID=UPI003403ECC3